MIIREATRIIIEFGKGDILLAGASHNNDKKPDFVLIGELSSPCPLGEKLPHLSGTQYDKPYIELRFTDRAAVDNLIDFLIEYRDDNYEEVI